jgi:uncharacterized membrane protein
MKEKRYLFSLVILVVLFAVLFSPGTVLAQEAEPAESGNVTMTIEFPRLEGMATDTFTFTNVILNYKGEQDRVFDLATIVPAGWSGYVTPQFDSTRISSISIAGSIIGTTKNMKVLVNPPSYPYAQPGDYTITLEASSDDVIGTIDLVARVLPKGVLNAVPSNRLYNTKAKAGQDNIFSIDVTDVGTTTIENVTFTVDKPEGWDITFRPEKLETLELYTPTTVDVVIRPSSDTMSGDYMFNLRVSGKDVKDSISMDIRVTVTTPTIWGWVGVAIILIVVIGLFFVFMRFGRR